MDLDEIDLKILELLSKDSRLSYSEIARHFGFSDVAIRKRVDKLVERGIIQAFTTRVDHKRLGKNVSAFVFFNTRSDKTQEIADQLIALPDVSNVYVSLGVYDIIALVHCADINALKDLTERKLKDINGILEVKPSIVFSEVVVDS
ncbi:MAG: Lrp/AsnC family transcriptional regulator [Candidatus Diapherotrites archaeon]|nr:Lrp/AsnC family transcriptional regulator [Candidatus Diapherotrites archaeon]